MTELLKVRFAPSPTGGLHPGNARVAIFNWLFAKKNKAKLLIRVEDTDIERSSLDFEKSILDDLKWLGIDWDEGPYRQSDRFSKYEKAITELVDKAYLYKCFCTDEELEEERKTQISQGKPPRYSAKCRTKPPKEGDKPYALRFDVDKFINESNGGNTYLDFLDLIKGKNNNKTEINLEVIGDFIVMKNSGGPTYNFAVVVDDIDMGITHIFRGEDHVSNTFRQIMLFYALGVNEENLPKFGHIPMLLANDKTKLSKRNGGIPIHEYKIMGLTPEAVFNHLAMIGGSVRNVEETSGKDVFISAFDYLKTSISPSVYDLDKLKSINAKFIELMKASDVISTMKDNEYMKNSGRNFSDYYDLMKRYYSDSEIIKIVSFLKEGVKTFMDILVELDIFIPSRIKDDQVYDFNQEQIKILEHIYNKYLDSNKKISGTSWADFKKTAQTVSTLKGGELFKTLRIIFTGKQKGPALDTVMSMMNDRVVFDRVQRLKTILG